MWPGRARSSGRVVGSTRASTVAARSMAEMPVVVPLRTSTVTRKAVRWASVLCSTMGRRSSSRARAEVIGAQM